MNQITIYVDGLCEPDPAGVTCYGWTAQDESGAEIASAHGHLLNGDGATNNVADFGAVIHALCHAKAQGWTGVHLRTDSQLVANQLNGEWGCNSDGLVRYLNAARQLMDEVGATITWVPRDQNQRADELSRQAYREKTGKEAPDRAATKRQKVIVRLQLAASGVGRRERMKGGVGLLGATRPLLWPVKYPRCGG